MNLSKRLNAMLPRERPYLTRAVSWLFNINGNGSISAAVIKERGGGARFTSCTVERFNIVAWVDKLYTCHQIPLNRRPTQSWVPR